MEINIQCPCGQHFNFEIEPVNGAMPCAVQCPNCGADDTHLANQVIARSQPQSSSILVPEPPAVGGLRINRPATEAPAASAETPQRFFTRTLEPDKAPPPSEENIPMGILGGLIASIIAMVAWYGLTVASNREFGLIAWLVGAFAGLGVRILGRDGTPALGFVAAVCACLAILGGKFMVTSHITNNYMKHAAAGVYDNQLVAAREAVNLKTDYEIRVWLQKQQKETAPVTQKEIDEFQTETRARMQDLVEGKPSRAEYEKKIVSHLTSFSVKFKIFQKTMTLFTVLWLVFGIVSAWRIGSA